MGREVWRAWWLNEPELATGDSTWFMFSQGYLDLTVGRYVYKIERDLIDVWRAYTACVANLDDLIPQRICAGVDSRGAILLSSWLLIGSKLMSIPSLINPTWVHATRSIHTALLRLPTGDCDFSMSSFPALFLCHETWTFTASALLWPSSCARPWWPAWPLARRCALLMWELVVALRRECRMAQ